MSLMESSAVLFARSALSSLAGLSFGGNRDLYQVFGWTRTPTHKQYLTKYLQQDIAQRVINAPVRGVWTDAPTIETADANFTKIWDELIAEHDIFAALAKVDIFAGLGAYSILVVGIDDNRPLNSPVGTGEQRQITYLQPYLEGNVEVIEFDENGNSPRFGKPVLYRVTPGEVSLTKVSPDAKLRSRKSFTVHYTRVLHVADNTLENPIFGHSRLKAVYNVLDDILKVTGGSAETYWLAANRGLHVDLDKEMELDATDAANLSDEIEEYQHELRRVIRTRGVKIANLGSDVADPRGVFSVLISLLSSNTGIPQRVLMGAEAGQLASQQDRANWANVLGERISAFGEPTVLKPFIKMLISMNVLPATAFSILWPEPFKMNPLERAQTSAQQARSLTNVARALETSQKIETDIVTIEEARQIVAPGDKLLILNDLPNGTMVKTVTKLPIPQVIDDTKKAQ